MSANNNARPAKVRITREELTITSVKCSPKFNATTDSAVLNTSPKVGRPVEKYLQARDNEDMTPAEEERQIAQVKAHLAAAFPSTNPDAVDTAVAAAYRCFDGKHIRDFIPLLVERRAKESLAAQVSA